MGGALAHDDSLGSDFPEQEIPGHVRRQSRHMSQMRAHRGGRSFIHLLNEQIPK